MYATCPTMRFVLQAPSLQHAAGVKIITHMWTQRDISTQIAKSFNPSFVYVFKEEDKEWKAIEESVESKVWALPLPKHSKKQLLKCVQPIGMEVIAWCRYHSGCASNFQFLDMLLGNHALRWTMHGTVDYKTTAELLLKDENLDVERRYEIACVNCLEDEAYTLFQSMSEERRLDYISELTCKMGKRFYYNFVAFRTRNIYSFKFPLMLLPSTETSTNKYLFEATLRNSSNRAACEYLFKKLSPKEKEQVLEEYAKLIYSCRKAPASCNLMCYWSLMNEEQRRRMFAECTRDVLICLLGWPLRSLLKEAVECGWSYMGRRHCAEVLNEIVVRIWRGFNDYDYCQLFWECWRLTFADYKFHFLDSIPNLQSLLQTKREKFMQLILNEAPSRQLKIAFHKIGYALLDECVISDAALLECKATAAFNSSNHPDNTEKRLRSEYVGRLVDTVMDSRSKSREK